MIRQIAYSDGWKYRLERPYCVVVEIRPARTVGNAYVTLDQSGVLTISDGYCWDGASGPAVDTPTILRGSLVHDALYQLIREGWLPRESREAADRVLRDLCIEDGMSALRAWWVHRAVRLFGPPDGGHTKPLKLAPGEIRA